MRIFCAAEFAALLLSIGASANGQPAAKTILVWSYGFSPHPVHLVAGREIMLVFVNQSGSRHDFSARRFFANSRIISGDAQGGEIEIAPHESRTVTLVPGAGTYPVHCSHLFHKQLGMTDEIIVD